MLMLQPYSMMTVSCRDCIPTSSCSQLRLLVLYSSPKTASSKLMQVRFLISAWMLKLLPRFMVVLMGSLFLYFGCRLSQPRIVLMRQPILRKRGDFLSIRDTMVAMWVRFIFSFTHSILSVLSLFASLDLTLGGLVTHLVSYLLIIAQSMMSDFISVSSQALQSLNQQSGAFVTFWQQVSIATSILQAPQPSLVVALNLVQYISSRAPSCVIWSYLSLSLSAWISLIRLWIFLLRWSIRQYCSLDQPCYPCAFMRMEQLPFQPCRDSRLSTWQSIRSEPYFLQMVMMSLGSYLNERKPFMVLQCSCMQQSGICRSSLLMASLLFFIFLSLWTQLRERMLTICWNCRCCIRTQKMLNWCLYLVGQVRSMVYLLPFLVSQPVLAPLVETRGHRNRSAPDFIICSQAWCRLQWAATSSGVSPRQSPPSMLQQATVLQSSIACFLIILGLLNTSLCREIAAGLSGNSRPAAQSLK